MGAFAEWQPEYAAAAVPTFPVTIDDAGKRPAVRGYLKVGSDYSRKLATRFPESQAFGFACGRRSRLTVLDVDTTDERTLADALARHGATPVVIRTASGKFHAWYRHNGERRMIRPDRSRPVDYLGAGYAIAPPSRGAGAEYRFLQGSLDDIGSLPVMRNVPAFSSRAAAEVSHTASAGERNSALFRRCLAAAHHCDDLDALLDVARTENDNFAPPLSESEVVKTAKSAWSYEQRGMNFVGSGAVMSNHAEIDSLLQRDPDAYVLLTLLRRWNGGEREGEFYVANAMHETMPGGGWRRQRFCAARAALETAGKIICIRPATPTTPARYRWPYGCPKLPTDLTYTSPLPPTPLKPKRGRPASSKRGGSWPA